MRQKWMVVMPTLRLVRRFFVQTRDVLAVSRALLSLGAVVLLSTGCGQVVTVKTSTPRPTQIDTLSPAEATVLPRATVTSALPTATRPNTPTPSPTPIIHVVQSGETLIAIALQYGVTVPALQSANGIDDPASLQVNQALIVPVAEENQADASNLGGPTPTPVAFAIEGFNCQEEPVGSLYCLGEVVNSTQTSLENVQLRVSLHNNAGDELMGGEVQAALDLIPSGERAPFGILFTSPPEGATRFTAHSIRAEASSEPGIRYAALVFDQVEAGPVGSLFEVTGQVTNPGVGAVTAIMVVVTTYGSEGVVTGFRQARLAEDIPAGGSAPFALSLMPQNNIPENYSLGVQGRPVSP